MYDWLILLRWGSLELLQGTFLYVISGRGLVNNNCQENGINADNYYNDNDKESYWGTSKNGHCQDVIFRLREESSLSF